MRESVFLFAMAIAATTVVMVARAIASAITGRGGSRSELAQMKEQLELHAAALEDAENTLTNQATQLGELQERLDFTERLLTQGRDGARLGPGESRE
jgi:uncharacterized protein YycO